MTLKLLPLFLGIFLAAENSSAAEKVLLPQGTYAPLFRDQNEGDQKVGPMWVDKYPVTNSEFQNFLMQYPQFAKSRIKRLFASADYLADWGDDFAFPEGKGAFPVTNVSWFVARKYCEKEGKRLLTTAEWEYASDAANPKNLETILAWYGETGAALKPVRQGEKNKYGLVGMHGLIWEWVEDFSSAIVGGDSRGSNETSRSMFCGSGSLKAKDPSQYASFMRLAHRSSLKADSVGRALGFRCAQDFKKAGKQNEK